MDERIEELLRLFYFKLKVPIDPRDDDTATLLDNLLHDLFDVCTDVASDRTAAQGFVPGIEALRCFLIYADQAWSSAAEAIGNKKLQLIAPTSSGNYLTVDTRGYIGTLLQLPREDRAPFNPILDEIVEEERRLHPEYLMQEGESKQPEIKLTKSQFEDIPSISSLLDRQLLAAYFETYGILETYRGMHDYDDPLAKQLAERMDLILKRLEETASGKT